MEEIMELKVVNGVPYVNSKIAVVSYSYGVNPSTIDNWTDDKFPDAVFIEKYWFGTDDGVPLLVPDLVDRGVLAEFQRYCEDKYIEDKFDLKDIEKGVYIAWDDGQCVMIDFNEDIEKTIYKEEI